MSLPPKANATRYILSTAGYCTVEHIHLPDLRLLLCTYQVPLQCLLRQLLRTL
jgi:hypothetical protein